MDSDPPPWLVEKDSAAEYESGHPDRPEGRDRDGEEEEEDQRQEQEPQGQQQKEQERRQVGIE